MGRVRGAEAAGWSFSNVLSWKIGAPTRAARILILSGFHVRPQIANNVGISGAFPVLECELLQGRVHLAQVFDAAFSLGHGPGVDEIRQRNGRE